MCSIQSEAPTALLPGEKVKTAERSAMHVWCNDCRHRWVACWLPMEISRAADVLLNAHCPSCGAPPAQIRVGAMPPAENEKGDDAVPGWRK